MQRMITASQCRAARALLGVRQDELAEWSGVAKGTLANFETGKRVPYGPNLEALRRALEEHGIVFMDATEERGLGVCLSRMWALRQIA